MDIKTWAHILADINEAIYDHEKNLKDADWDLKIAETELKIANDGKPMPGSKSIPFLTSKIESLRKYIATNQSELNRLHERIDTHYKNKPEE